MPARGRSVARQLRWAGAAAFAFLAVVFGTWAASGSAVAQQESDAAVFFGFVSQSEDGALPTRVQSLVGGVNCGSGDVNRATETLGFYVLSIEPASVKPGCGVEGAPVTFLLLAGEIDPGSPAAQTQAWTVGTQRLDLSAVPDAAFGAFVGELPVGPGIGMMRWSGASATPIEEAVSTIARDVESVSHFDVPSQSFRSFIPGAPAIVSDYLLVDRDDIIAVRVR